MNHFSALDPRLLQARQWLTQGNPNQAETETRSVLSENRNDPSAQLLLAVICFRTGRMLEAEEILENMRRAWPDQPEAISLLAVIKKNRNDLQGAALLFEHLVGAGFGTVDAYNQLGSCRLGLGDFQSAGSAFKRAIEIDRTVAHSYYNLGMALKLSGKSFETFMTFKRAAELDPNFQDTYVQIWQQMRQLLNWREGLPLLESGLKLHPDSTQMMVMVASTYGKLGMPERAEDLFLSAMKLNPSARPPYAHWLQEQGRFSDSIPVLKQAIREVPVQGQAYYNLAVAKCFEIEGRSMIDTLSPILTNKSLDAEERMFLHYALAKAHEHERNDELAMRHYDMANDLAFSLYNAHLEHNSSAIEFEHRNLVNLYSREAIKSLQAHGSKSSVPIFIVGMIRTGTTLLDQILSSHSKVKSAGEQPFWQVSAGRVNRRWLESGLESRDIKDLAASYERVLYEAVGTSPRITDKMPTNFTHMGLMSIAFPKSKFIHIRRNPIDTCLSIYTTFLGSGTQFAYCQENIVSYYREYLRAMEHWRGVIPSGQLIEIDYEDLVSQKEKVVRQVLEFCGLEWDEACLRHEQNATQVSTPSLYTARQPVNARSVERWKRFEPWLGALLQLKEIKT